MSEDAAVRPSGDLVFIGDVHLDRDDPDLEAFVSFLDRLRGTVSRIVLLGDLFNLWFGSRHLERPHHRAVIERLERLRGDGVVVRYVEGNRDYWIGSRYAGRGLDEASDRGFAESFGALRLFAIHGDLVNRHDRQYRTWRRLSRSTLGRALFRALPRRAFGRMADRLEIRMRATNVEHKQEFPEDEVRRYAAGWLARGYDAVVLGHFHVERTLEARAPSAPGRIFVLPCWKDGRRHLRVTPGGEIDFVDSPC